MYKILGVAKSRTFRVLWMLEEIGECYEHIPSKPRSKEIKKLNHVFTTGDSLSKIAFKHYGDARYWWVLAWFNAKPTDFHCEIGDIIEIPLPLEEVILKARDRIIL